MNILVTGANGQLGHSLRKVVKEKKDKFFWTDINELDITDESAVEHYIVTNHIQLVVNCAAYTNVDAAESNQEAARKINTDAPAILARIMRKYDGGLIHISTDYVFGGCEKAIPYKEEDAPAPLGVYGCTKLDGEWEVKAHNPRHIIIRTAWLYSEFGKNFVITMMNLTSRLPEVKVVFDQVGTPTYAGDLANVIVKIIEDRAWQHHPGTYHYSNEGVCSWYDFARRIALSCGHAACSVVPCHSNEFPSSVTRPPYSVLDKTKIKDILGVKVPYWTESLDRCLTELIV